MRALVIEDDHEVSEAMSVSLQVRWPDIDIAVAPTGKEGLTQASEPTDVVLLDINLPDISGFEVLKKIREVSSVPVIIVTVRGADRDQVQGLEAGADDYIVKPFHPSTLVSRVNAVLRRAQPHDPKDRALVSRGGILLNLLENTVLVDDKKVNLTPTESKLLYALMGTLRRTVPNATLLTEVWGEEYRDNELVLRSYIGRIRNKLGDNPPRLIMTDRGQGYRFVSPGER